jgi:hypothetical protein
MHFFLLKDDQIFTRLSLEHKELRYVNIFRLSLMVPEILYMHLLINIINSV